MILTPRMFRESAFRAETMFETIKIEIITIHSFHLWKLLCENTSGQGTLTLKALTQPFGRFPYCKPAISQHKPTFASFQRFVSLIYHWNITLSLKAFFNLKLQWNRCFPFVSPAFKNGDVIYREIVYKVQFIHNLNGGTSVTWMGVPCPLLQP